MCCEETIRSGSPSSSAALTLAGFTLRPGVAAWCSGQLVDDQLEVPDGWR
jgi:hypothetical protein